MSDYVLSNDTVSKVLAMVAESREVHTVLDQLLGKDGCNLLVYPIHKYVSLKDGENDDGGDNEYSYWDLFTRVRMHGEILLGWARSGVLEMNPKGGSRDEMRRWRKNDTLVVLSAFVDEETKKSAAKSDAKKS